MGIELRTGTAKVSTIATLPAPQETACRAGLISGTGVMTLQGERPVEALAPGDRIVTRSGMAVLRDIRVTEADVAPIRIRAGSLGHTRPDRDTYLPPDTPVHVRDWRAMAMFGTASADVPARRLADGLFVAPAAKRTMHLVELVFDSPQVIYADGLEVVTGR